MDSFKNILKIVIIPVCLFAILGALTTLLLKERESMNPLNEEVWERGDGQFQPTDLDPGSWVSYYGGGEGVDKIIGRNDSSLRVSTGGDGGWYGARTTVGKVDLSRSSVGFSFKAYDWDQLDRVVVLFFSNDSLEDYYGINLKNYFSHPADNEWLDIILNSAEFEVIEGSPDWKKITHVAVRVVPVPGVSTRVWFDDFNFIETKQPEPIVSLTFDDGLATVMEAANIMDSFGVKGTAFVVPELLNTEGHLTQEQVDALSTKGWDISAHGKDNLTEMLPPDVDTHLAATYKYLSDNNYQGVDHYAYPNGAYSESVRSQVAEYFTSARTIDGFHQPMEYLYPTNVNAITISSSTPLSTIINEIDMAKANNTWLILVWHDIKPIPVLDTEYDLYDFSSVVGYLKSEGIKVRTYSEVYSRIVDNSN